MKRGLKGLEISKRKIMLSLFAFLFLVFISLDAKAASKEDYELIIRDSKDGSYALVNETINFYANYTKSSVLVSGAECNISFIDGTWTMAQGIDNYNFTRNFSEKYSKKWNVTCKKDGDISLNETDNVLINTLNKVVFQYGSEVPYFSIPSYLDTKDAHINVANGDTNYNEDYLSVHYTTSVSYQYKSLISFNLSKLYLKNIQAIKLGLYRYLVSAAQPSAGEKNILLYKFNNDWNETNITYNEFNSLYSPVMIVNKSITDSSIDNWYELNLSNFTGIQNQDNFSVNLYLDTKDEIVWNEAKIQFRSKEYTDASMRPKITAEFLDTFSCEDSGGYEICSYQKYCPEQEIADNKSGTCCSVPCELDLSAPIVSNRVERIVNNTFNISYNTNEPSTTIINWGKNKSCLNSSYSLDLKTEHSIKLFNLTYGVSYYYRIITNDTYSNSNSTINYSFYIPFTDTGEYAKLITNHSGRTYVNNNITIYANYLNKTDISRYIPNSSCRINISSNVYSMSNSSPNIFNISFNVSGNYSYKISCNHSEYKDYVLSGSHVVISDEINFSVWDNGPKFSGANFSFYALIIKNSELNNESNCSLIIRNNKYNMSIKNNSFVYENLSINLTGHFQYFINCSGSLGIHLGNETLVSSSKGRYREDFVKNFSKADSRWHLDGDGDSIPDDIDNCPYAYNPYQEDINNNGICDYNEQNRTLDGNITDFRATVVTPYGLWFKFTSTRNDAYYTSYILFYSENKTDILTSESRQRLYDSGKYYDFYSYQIFNYSTHEFVVRDLNPNTTYYLAIDRISYNGLRNEVSNNINITTHPVQEYFINNERPSLVISREQLSELKQRYQDSDSYVLDIISRMKPSIHAYANLSDCGSCFKYGINSMLIYEITGDNAYYNYAKAALDIETDYIYNNQYADGANQYRGYASDYLYLLDLMWNNVSYDYKKDILKRLVEIGDDHSGVRIGDTDEVASLSRTFILLGLLAKNDFSGTEFHKDLWKLVDKGLRFFYGVQMPRAKKSFGYMSQSGGFSDDGSKYGQNTIRYWIETFNALKLSNYTSKEFDFYSKNILYANLIYSKTPSKKGFFPYNDIEDPQQNNVYERDSFIVGERADMLALHLLNFIENETERSYLHYFLNTTSIDYEKDSRGYLYLINYNQSKAYESKSLEPFYYDRGYEIFLDRTSWEKNATYFSVHNGWRSVDHTHFDDGNFQIYRNQTWLLHNNLGYAGYSGSCEAYNTICLEGKTYTEDAIREIPDRHGYDGHYSPINPNTIQRENDFDYFKLDMTKAYDEYTTKVYNYDKVIRSLLWIKGMDNSPDYFLVYDYIKSKPEYSNLAKEVVFNFRFNATLEDNILHYNRSGQKLDVVSLLSENKNITLQDIQDWGDSSGPDYTLSMIIKANESSNETRFFNVLAASNINQIEVDNNFNELIYGEKTIGAFINKSCAVFFSNSTVQINKTSYSLNSIKNTRHFVLDLIPQKRYYVYENGVFSQEITTSDKGVLSFNSSATGIVYYNIQTDYNSSDSLIVSLLKPLNGSEYSQGFIIFNCSVTGINLTNATLYGNWTNQWGKNKTILLNENSANAVFNLTLNKGNYVWNSKVCNNNSVCGFASSNYTFKVSSVVSSLPYPKFLNISNTSITNSSAIISLLSSQKVNYSLEINSLRFENNSYSTNYTLYLSSLNSNTLYRYNFTICNNESMCNTSSNYNFTTLFSSSVSNFLPNITLLSPEDNFEITDDLYANLSFRVTDKDYSSLACSFIINGSIIREAAAQNNSINTLSYKGTDKGVYNYSVNCTDSINISSSESRIFSINLSDLSVGFNDSEWDNGTTDFNNLSNSELRNIENATFINSYGLVRFLNNITLTRNINISNNIIIQKNRVFVNSTNISEFNKSAEIRLYNLTFSSPRILKDGQVCTCPCCNLTNYSGGNLSFIVNSFSEYKTEETPTCSDGILNQGETGIDCGGPCSPCPTTIGGSSGGGGGGGSSGGGYIRKKENKTIIINQTKLSENRSCIEDYVCSNWSNCLVDNMQFKTCTDRNNCSEDKVWSRECPMNMNVSGLKVGQDNLGYWDNKKIVISSVILIIILALLIAIKRIRKKYVW